MRNKKVIFGAVIAVLLILAFFIGGDRDVTPLQSEEASTTTRLSDSGADNNKEKEESDFEEETEKSDSAAQTSDEKEVKPAEEGEAKQAAEQDSVAQEGKQTQTAERAPPEQATPASPPAAPVEKKVDHAPAQQKAEKAKIIAQDQANKDKKDKYLTDPVPAGKPKPVEPQDVIVDKKKPLTATLSVTSKTILNNMHLFNKNKLEVLPADGVIYAPRKVTFYEGESVFDVLLREMRSNKIHMEFTMTPVYNSHYIEGINNIYEFDCGELSGWMYKVNGWFPNYGASRYYLKDGDVIDWVYTCDLGRDIGGAAGVIGGQ
ncbi:hypothetical protein BEP19_13520 [Ammoniphilus oxalaticus]|uniref:Transcobalamin-like C-terminal domain-containing protein n=1 Tax=Ammoniphilus oxalaticus TaxID=66863 RepID=A0A419SFA2_9BACL|nr:DUF4430 domain-containing protein [Ammoniphilus oxalaticus]RKD22105.1 hypothetical protein BEP19_13520 [Ammoniphilus oxalaticus]